MVGIWLFITKMGDNLGDCSVCQLSAVSQTNDSACVLWPTCNTLPTPAMADV